MQQSNDTKAPTLRIVVTGATGFVGQQLVPRLVRAGAEVLLVGRNAASVQACFVGHQVCEPGDISTRAKGFDLLIHLATRNNDRLGPEQEFEAANVDFLLQIAKQAEAAGVGRFVNVSTVQALADPPRGAYATSKRRGLAALDRANLCMDIRTHYLPLVYGDRFAGKLAWMNRVPVAVRRAALPVMAALKPVLHIDRLTAAVLADTAPAILSDGQCRNPVYRTVRWLIDISFALVVLGGFWWMLAALWVGIKVTSPGPGIFAQTRVGQGGRAFTCYKFRTMAQGTQQLGTHEISAAAVTPIGRILRRSKLDELPQVVNILRGELSLIGPRPCLPVQTELVAARHARGVLDIRPGITGLAQVEGIDMSDPQTLSVRDAEYVALQSLVLDVGIALKTVKGGGRGDRVQM